jgi:hypothetical protein
VDGSRDGILHRIQERFRDNTKIWAFCLVLVLAFGVYLLIAVSHQETFGRVKDTPPPHSEEGPYLDESHNKFIDEFNTLFKKHGIATESRFINAGMFQVIVPSDTLPDDINQVSRWAAVSILRKFHNAPIVNVYTRDPNNSSKLKHVTITEWFVTKSKSDFVVRPAPGAGSSEPSK